MFHVALETGLMRTLTRRANKCLSEQFRVRQRTDAQPSLAP